MGFFWWKLFPELISQRGKDFISIDEASQSVGSQAKDS
jgi:hypothetical protein